MRSIPAKAKKFKQTEGSYLSRYDSRHITPFMDKLLDNKYKLPGKIFVATGMVLAAIYFLFDFRFEAPVFAFFSSYMKTRFLTTFKTNFADETIMLLLVVGFFLWAFSKEKHESKAIGHLRSRALYKTIITETGILLFSILFIYGSGFIGIILINMILPFILYLFYFNFLLVRERRNGKLV